MSFLNRIFSRKSKSTGSGLASGSFRRSLTDPQPPATAVSSSSEKGDTDTFDVCATGILPRPRGRRAGCDLIRARTSVEPHTAHSIRSSLSSNGGDADDPVSSRYKLLSAMHRSRQHTIMAGQDRHTRLPVVLKAYPKAKLGTSAKAKLDSELQHLRALCGVPGVVKLLNYVEDNETCYIVQERCPGSTLIELLAAVGGRLTERMLVVDVLIPLLECLSGLHANGVVHRQLKPEHIMVGGSGVRSLHLLDFSEAACIKQRCLNNRTGALEYMAPEVLSKPTAEEVFHQVLYNGMSEEELPQYDEKADLWSLGTIAYEALTGCQPFLADSASEMMQVQRDALSDVEEEGGMPRFFAGRSLSDEALSFLRAVLQADPAARPSAEQLLQQPLVQRYFGQYQAAQLFMPQLDDGIVADADGTSFRHAAAASAAAAAAEPPAQCAVGPMGSRASLVLPQAPAQFAVR